LYNTTKICLKVIARETKQSHKITKITSPSEYIDVNNIQTFIIGSKPDTSSFRNFVSLDTRSREIRHQDLKSKKTANIIIRKYMSSGGVEYFISFEDQFGYLYGFTRLLLPTDPVDVK
jgi:histone acetyltransferase (RNA polymerase elongator complex component)